jgi:hypothetical protein
VDVRIGENIDDFLEEIGQEGVSGVFGGVDGPQLTIGLVIGVTSCQQLGMRQPPRTGVTGSVELRNHSNPSNTSVLDDFAHVTLFVHFGDGVVGTFFAANVTLQGCLDRALLLTSTRGTCDSCTENWDRRRYASAER